MFLRKNSFSDSNQRTQPARHRTQLLRAACLHVKAQMSTQTPSLPDPSLRPCRKSQVRQGVIKIICSRWSLKLHGWTCITWSSVTQRCCALSHPKTFSIWFSKIHTARFRDCQHPPIGNLRARKTPSSPGAEESHANVTSIWWSI